VVLYLETPPPSRPLTAYPALDQIGNPDGLYVWGNVSSGGDLYLYPTPDRRGINYWLKEGRDYYRYAKPGYTPYPYPHPLRSKSAYTPQKLEIAPVGTEIYRGP
jgi:hypothetical protein